MQVARRVDWPDLVALLVSGVLAAAAPLQVFLLAYALLGPFHYLTEIAWLRKKQFYFREGLISSRSYLLIAVGMAVLAPLEYIVKRDLGFWIIASLLLLSLTVWVRNVYALGALAVVVVAMKFVLRPWIFFIAILIPTLIHVYFFTWTFMLSGALRDKRATLTKWINPVLLVLIPVALMCMRLQYTAPGGLWLRGEAASFGPLHAYFANDLHHTLTLGATLLQDPVVAVVMRVFAFIYLFHYLNWFAKTELLQWHRISPREWTGIGLLYLATIAIYLRSFRAGFIVAAFLSMLHVLLEFPLNWHTLRFVSLRLHGKNAEARTEASATMQPVA
jgi:hypothetical protein